MKKSLFSAAVLLTVVSLMSLTSCQKETADGVKQFRATMEGCTSDDGKTTLEGTALNWVSGDEVAIYGTAGRAIFSASPLTPATTAELICQEGVAGEGTYRAFYPSTLTTDGVNVTLPAVQNTVDGSLAQFPMYAQSDDENLSFKNLCGALVIHLQKSDVEVSSITVTADANINGRFGITYAGVPTLRYLDGGSASTTLLCSQPQSIANGKDFYVYMPHGTYSSLCIEIEDAEGNICTKTTKPNVTTYIHRSQTTRINLGPNHLTFAQRFPQGMLPGLFSVSATQQVRFSQGILQYNPASQIFRFAKDQCDYTLKGHSLELFSFDTMWREYFGWGTGNNPNASKAELDNLTGAPFVDWGINAISNGGNQPNIWHTMSKEEWDYIVNLRPNAASKIAVAVVGSERGLVLLPDNWTLPTGCSFTPGFTTDGQDYSLNTYSLSEWKRMEAAGAVFVVNAGLGVFIPAMPFLGRPEGFFFSGTTAGTNYWTSSEVGPDVLLFPGQDPDAGGIAVNVTGVRIDVNDYTGRSACYPVRLVKYE